MMITHVYPALHPSVPSDFSGRETNVGGEGDRTEKVTEKQRQADGDKEHRCLGDSLGDKGSHCGLHTS